MGDASILGVIYKCLGRREMCPAKLPRWGKDKILTSIMERAKYANEKKGEASAKFKAQSAKQENAEFRIQNAEWGSTECVD